MLINAVPREEMNERLQESFDVAAGRAGTTDFIQAAANAPEVLEWFLDSFYGKVFYGGRVDVRIKEIVRLRLARAHGCVLCNRMDTYDALEAGVDPETVDAITAWPDELDESRFTRRELAALRYADQMILHNGDGYLDPQLYDELRHHYDDGEIFELGVTLAVLTGMAKFLFIADLVPKADNCPIPSRA